MSERSRSKTSERSTRKLSDMFDGAVDVKCSDQFILILLQELRYT